MTDDAMHLDFAVIADYALVDQAGKLSVLGIFQHIWVQQFPATHPRLHLVLRLKGRRTEVASTPCRSDSSTSKTRRFWAAMATSRSPSRPRASRRSRQA